MDLIQDLIKQKKISKKEAVDLKMQAKQFGKTQESILLENKILKENELFKLKSKLCNVPFKEVAVDQLVSSVLNIIPVESADYYKMVPMAIDKNKAILEVGMVYPEDSQSQEALKFLTRQQKLRAKVFLISFSDFNKILEKYKAPKKEVEKALETLEKEIETEKPGAQGAFDKAKFERIVEEAPVIKMVAVILRQAVDGKASDIHIEPGKEKLRVRYRMDGILYSSLLLPLKILPAIVARIKILSNLKIDEVRIPQDGRFSTKVADKNIDFRVATFPTSLGEKVVLRVLDSGGVASSLKDLGLRDRNYEVVKAATKRPNGMILVTGPTGSGKTTTLYTILQLLNKEGVNIVTLEDPVEYFMEGINQSQVRPDIGYSFATGLRQILRQDPDIIMVGEIRDDETANLAIHAALTGHLVLSTLHTTNAAGVVPRLADMGVELFLLSATLSVVISQRLARGLCPFCKRKVKAQGESKKYILDKVNALPYKLKDKINIKDSFYIFEPKGCKKCNQKGYKGRVGIFETLEMTENLGNIIMKNPIDTEIIQEGRNQGMLTMEEDGIIKVLEGVTSLEEIMRVAEEK